MYQSDWALFTLGLNSSQFFSQSLFQIISASIPEVTSMQVFECIGEEWKYPLQIFLLEVCLPRGVQGL
jgi:hypothetical protein